MSKRKAAPHQHLADQILSELSQFGPYIYHKAVTSNSIYVKFPHWGLGSVRIGDHTGRQKYRYRWQLRTDCAAGTWSQFDDRGVLCTMFGTGQIARFAAEFARQADERGIKPGSKQTWDEFCEQRSAS